jgi:hypothetical protein
MKNIGIWTLILGLTLSSCNQENKKSTTTDNSKDKEEIQSLIRQVLIWADSKNCIDLLPVVTDENDSIYIGFDLDKLKQNLDKLNASNFFATEFIDNYNQIIITLDKGLRNGDYEQWYVNELPTFIFANDNSPWCNCQDNLEWDKVEVKVVSLDENKGEVEWYWGNLSPDTDLSWKEFRYKFRVTKEENKWKIAYLEGFNFKESTRKDGQQ